MHDEHYTIQEYHRDGSTVHFKAVGKTDMIRLLQSSCFSTPGLPRTGIGIAVSTTMENRKKTVLTVGSTYLMKFMNT